MRYGLEMSGAGVGIGILSLGIITRLFFRMLATRAGAIRMSPPSAQELEGRELNMAILKSISCSLNEKRNKALPLRHRGRSFLRLKRLYNVIPFIFPYSSSHTTAKSDLATVISAGHETISKSSGFAPSRRALFRFVPGRGYDKLPNLVRT